MHLKYSVPIAVILVFLAGAFWYVTRPAQTVMTFGDASGALSPGTTADDATVGTQAWSNPNNAQASDGVYALETIYTFAGDASTHYLKATNFGFSIPVGATINGIVMDAQVYDAGFASDNYVKDQNVRIVKGGVIGATNVISATVWPQTEAYISHGSSSNLWGETWTAADINASNFGVAISAVSNGANFAQGGIDHIRITVYYTTAASTVPQLQVKTGILNVKTGIIKILN